MAVSPFDCNAVLALCAQGDQDAFFELYRHETPSMLALATQLLGSPREAEDLVRDTLIIIWKNADAWSPATGTARAWVHSILRYRARSTQRQKHGHESPMPAAHVTGLHNTQAGGLMGESEFSGALAALDDTQREPLLMAFYHGYTYEQMEGPLQQTAVQIKENLRRGLQELEAAVLA